MEAIPDWLLWEEAESEATRNLSVGSEGKLDHSEHSGTFIKTTNANQLRTSVATSDHREKHLISSYRSHRPERQYFSFCSSSSSAGVSNYSNNKMAITDLLNRRVRARPEDEEVFSEASGSEDGSQDGSDAESNGSMQSVS